MGLTWSDLSERTQSVLSLAIYTEARGWAALRQDQFSSLAGDFFFSSLFPLLLSSIGFFTIYFYLTYNSRLWCIGICYCLGSLGLRWGELPSTVRAALQVGIQTLDEKHKTHASSSPPFPTTDTRSRRQRQALKRSSGRWLQRGVGKGTGATASELFEAWMRGDLEETNDLIVGIVGQNEEREDDRQRERRQQTKTRENTASVKARETKARHLSSLLVGLAMLELPVETIPTGTRSHSHTHALIYTLMHANSLHTHTHSYVYTFIHTYLLLPVTLLFFVSHIVNTSQRLLTGFGWWLQTMWGQSMSRAWRWL